VRRLPIEPRRQFRRQQLGAAEPEPQIGQRRLEVDPGLEDRPQHRGDDDDPGGAGLGQDLDQPPRVLAVLLVDEPRRGAVEERPEQVPDRVDEAEGGDVAPRFAGGEGVGRTEPARQVDGAPVEPDDALRRPGRAGGVDDVGGGVGGEVDHRGAVRLPFDLGPVAVQEDGPDRPRGQPGDGGLVADQHRRPGIVEHERQALGRVGRVERDGDAARLEDGEEADDQPRRPRQAEADRHPRPHPERAQAVGQAVRPPVEIAVGQMVAAGKQRGRLGRARGPGFEPAVDGGVVVRRCLASGGVVRAEEPSALRLGQQRQGRDAAIGVGDRPFEQGSEVSGEAGNGGGVEEVGRVLDRAAHLAAGVPPLLEVQEEVEHGGAGVDIEEGAPQPRAAQRGRQGVLKRDHHRRQRRPD
jgi:hypothetical protein